MIRFVRDSAPYFRSPSLAECLPCWCIKLADLALDGSRWISGDAPVNAEGVVRHASDLPNGAGGTLSWAQQMFNFPVNGETGQSGEAPRGDLPIPRSELARINRGDGEGDTTDVTGSIAAEPAASAAAGAKPSPAKPGAEKPGPRIHRKRLTALSSRSTAPSFRPVPRGRSSSACSSAARNWTSGPANSTSGKIWSRPPNSALPRTSRRSRKSRGESKPRPCRRIKPKRAVSKAW